MTTNKLAGPTTKGRRGRRSTNVILWVAQALLGFFFAGSGFGKILMLDPALYAQAPQAVEWYAALSQPLIVFIGICEVLGGIGLILPAMTGVRPRLTPLSADGLAVLMVLAGGFHIMRGEFEFAVLNVALAATCGFISVRRRGKNRVAPAVINTRRVLHAGAVIAAIALLAFAPTWYTMTHTQF